MDVLLESLLLLLWVAMGGRWSILERPAFRRKYGIDGYDAVLGKGLKAYLDARYAFPGCSWELTLERHDPLGPAFWVRFTDGGKVCGTAAITWRDGRPNYEATLAWREK